MNRRSFIAAVLTLLGLRPKPTVQAEPVYWFRKHSEGDGWSSDPFPRDVTMRPVVKLRGRRIHLWTFLGGPDEC